MKKAKNPKKYLILWCMAYVVFSIASSVYVSYQEVINGIDCTQFGGPYQLITLCFVLFGFLPALYGVYRITKQSDSKKYEKIVCWMLIITGSWTAMMVVFTLLSWFAPGVIDFIVSVNESLGQG